MSTMPINPLRGEMDVELSGRRYRLVLTLGALAQLEQGSRLGSLSQLLQRMEQGDLRASDLIALLQAALAGGGQNLPRDEVANLQHADGLSGLFRTLVALMDITFNPHKDADTTP